MSVVAPSPSDGPARLRAQGLHASLSQGTGWTLRDVSLEISRGELVHLKGDNGSGKSTLLRILAGLVRPSRGRVEVGGEPVDGDPTGGRRRVAYVPDSLVPSPWLSPAEYLSLRTQWRGRAGDLLPEALEETLAEWGLQELRERPIGALSHGERRRALLVSVFLAPAEVLLLDEPTNGLDRRYREATVAALRRVREAAAVVVTIGHRERALRPTPRDGGKGVERWRAALSVEGLEVREAWLGGGADPLAGDAVLAILGPREAFDEPELVALRRFVDGGGAVLLAVDPEAVEVARPLLKVLGAGTPGGTVVDGRGTLAGAGPSTLILEPVTDHPLGSSP